MASGQKEIVINNLEKLISDDSNDMQAFRAQILSDVVQALAARSYSNWEQPGVSVPSAGAAATPMNGVVVDGLEMIVDNPGSILVSKGVMGCWNGDPATDKDSGFLLICDPGIQTLGVLTYAANSSGSPRCDVIECAIDDDQIIQENRDILDETTEEFTPATVDKIVKGQLKYQITQGTPGAGPGYRAGWLPIGLLVIQSGVTTGQVDFYDVRPLLRELGQSLPQHDSFFKHQVVPNVRNYVQVTGATPVANAIFDGISECSIDGVRFGGPLYRNSPLAAASIANFGLTTADGGDQLTIRLSTENTLRGAGFSVAAKDTVVLAAFLPDLGGSVPLPRCVRYCQNNHAGMPTQPSRTRKPFGPNGIILAVALSQDALSANGVFSLIPLFSTGIAGCMGQGHGVPLTLGYVDAVGTTLGNQIDGFASGMAQDAPRGRIAVKNRIVDSLQLSESGGLNSTSISSSTPSLITNSDRIISVRQNDKLHITWGPLICSANSVLNGSVQFRITEDFGLSATPVVTKEFLLPTATTVPLTFPFEYTVTKTGNLQIAMLVKSADNSHTVQVETSMDEWGTYTLVRLL